MITNYRNSSYLKCQFQEKYGRYQSMVRPVGLVTLLQERTCVRSCSNNIEERSCTL